MTTKDSFFSVRRVVVYLAVLSMLFASAAAPFDQPTPPPPVIHIGYADWAKHPAVPQAYDQQGSVPPETSQIEPSTIDSCIDYPYDPDANRFIRLAYQKWYWMGMNWDIFMLDSCDTDFVSGWRLASNLADDFYPNLDPINKQVVFVSDRDGNDELYRVNTDDTNLQRLTNSPAVDTTPAYSPDGQRIAFVSDRTGNAEIFVMNADGSGIKQLTNYSGLDLEPSWSPDGSKIIWVRVISSSDGVFYTMNGDGSDQQPLTGPVRAAGYPRWSPSGSQIAFTYDADGNNWFDIGMMNANGSNLHLALQAPAPTTTTGVDLITGTWLGNDEGFDYTRYQYQKHEDGWYLDSGTVCTLNGSCISQSYDWKYGLYDLGAFPSAVALDRQAPTGSLSVDEYVPSTGYHVHFTFDDIGLSGVCIVNYSYGYAPDQKTATITLFNTYLRRTRPFYPGLFEQTADPGSTIYYWLEVEDCAENWRRQDEPDAVVHVYGVKTEGAVLDQRGQPVNGASMDLSRDPLAASPVSEPDGSAAAYFTAAGETQAEFVHAGFGNLPQQNWPLLNNEQFVQVMAPVDEQITNGGFEDGDDPLTNWSTTGSSAPVIVSGHTGANALKFGEFCPPEDDCLGSLEPVTVSSEMYSPQVYAGIDGQGTNYLMMVYTSNDSLVFDVARYQKNGGWQPVVRELSLSGSTHRNLLPVVDPAGTLHLIYYQKDENDSFFDELYYTQKLAGGVWSQPKRIAAPSREFTSAAITTDPKGLVHVAFAQNTYNAPDRIFITRRDLNGVWSDPVNLMNVSEAREISLTAGEDSTTHIIYSEYNVWQYTSLPLGAGKSSLPVTVCDKCTFRGMDVAPDGTVHIVITNSANITRDIVKNPFTGWDFSRTLKHEPTGIDIDRQGYLHAISGSYYMVVPPNGVGYEEALLPIDGQDIYTEKILVDQDGSIHMLYRTVDYINGVLQQDYNHHQLAKASQADSASVERTIQVPSDLIHPTLSFLYRWMGYASANTRFRATLIPPSGPVVNLLPIVKGGNWQPAWADLTPYAGKTVTLRFQFDQAVGERSAFAMIDEISLGSWNTPVIKQITTPQICPQQSTGALLQAVVENFQDGGQVLVDGQPAVLVSYQPGSGLIVSQLPENVAVGFLSLHIINPGGADALSPGVFYNGCRVLLPQIKR